MEFVLVLSCCILMAADITAYSVYGPVYDNSNFSLDNYELNLLDKSIISDCGNFNAPYISNVPFSLLFKYYISDYGVVPRWSALHKQIKNKFKELKSIQHEHRRNN